MKIYLITAFRNEEKSIAHLIDELYEVMNGSGLLNQTNLTLVDDLSTDCSVSLIQEKTKQYSDFKIELVSLKTNLGNQASLAYALRRLKPQPEDLIISFDADGEDDIRKIPELVNIAKNHPEHIVYTTRGSRNNSIVFKVLYKFFFIIIKMLTGITFLPNNFLVLPGKYHLPATASSLLPVYYSLNILRLGLPYTSVIYDRRPRIDGKSSQNIYNLINHGLVGLLIFHETVLAKVYSWLMVSIFLFILSSSFALFIKLYREQVVPGWLAMFLTIDFGFILLSSILLIFVSFLSTIMKLQNYYLSNLKFESKEKNRD